MTSHIQLEYASVKGLSFLRFPGEILTHTHTQHSLFNIYRTKS